MSHKDKVASPPPGFRVIATTSTCETGSIENAEKRIFGVQFHPEVVHTTEGMRILSNYLFDICGCEKDWNPSGRVGLVKQQIRHRVADRNVFFFVSGGVDSTVAFMLCLDALGSERVTGVYVDTGLMREAETQFVRDTFAGMGVVRIEDCAQEFLSALEGAREPELKRHIIGEQFVKVQERIIEERGLLDEPMDSRPGEFIPTPSNPAALLRQRPSRRIITASGHPEADGLGSDCRATGGFLQRRGTSHWPRTRART